MNLISNFNHAVKLFHRFGKGILNKLFYKHFQRKKGKITFVS